MEAHGRGTRVYAGEAGVYLGDVMKEAEMDRPSMSGMPRSRGAVSGLLLVILGAWGALIPFVGPHFNFAYTPDRDWVWSIARGWLEVLPGTAAVVGGLLLIAAGSRFSAMLGAWLAALAGAWFVVGCQLAPLLGIGSAGDPIAATERKQVVLQISYFSGLGVLIVFVAGVALARTAARLARDVQPAQPVQPMQPCIPEHRRRSLDRITPGWKSRSARCHRRRSPRRRREPRSPSPAAGAGVTTSQKSEHLQVADVLDDDRRRDMRNVFVGADFRVLHRRAEPIGRGHRPVRIGFSGFW